MALLAALPAAAAKKPAARETVNASGSTDRVSLDAVLILDPSEVRAALGADLEPGYVVVRVKVTPKGDPLRVTPDDFTLLSRKDGERADALAPAQIASKSALTVKRDTRGREWAEQTNQPGFIGIAGIKRDSDGKDDAALLTALRARILPDRETASPAEGLLYFSLDTAKLKPKDLSLLYKGAGGRVTIDFSLRPAPVIDPRPAEELP